MATTKRTRKLGKAQERRLNAALTTDDLLYRQFRRMKEDLDRASERLIRRPTRVVRVLGMHPNGVAELLPIASVAYSADGISVVVELLRRPEKGKKS